MALFHSFLWLSSIPLYIFTAFSLPVHLLMDTQVASMFGYCEMDSTVLDSIVLLPYPELWPDVPLDFFSPPSWPFSLLSPSFLRFGFFPPLETPFVFSFCHFVRSTRISSRPGVPRFQDLMPNDLRWSWCNNNRNKAHNKCNVLESSRNCSPPSHLWSGEELSSMKPAPGARKVGGPLRSQALWLGLIWVWTQVPPYQLCDFGQVSWPLFVSFLLYKMRRAIITPTLIGCESSRKWCP